MDPNYFYSLIQPSAKRKERTCLKCNVKFMSNSAGHRICGGCQCLLNTKGKLASITPFSNPSDMQHKNTLI